MGFLLDTLDLAKLNAQRDIVKNERRQGVDNQPYGRAGEILAAGDLPGVAPLLVGRHRQHGGPLGRVRRGREELLPPLLRAEQRLPRRSSATSTRRRPRRGCTKYFGDIPRGKPITRPKVDAGDARPRRSASSSRIACRCRGSTCSGRRVGEKHDDRFALDVLGAILAGAAHRAAHQGAGLRQAGRRVGVGRSEHQRGRRRVHA